VLTLGVAAAVLRACSTCPCAAASALQI
jgi:hypothetical protein